MLSLTSSASGVRGGCNSSGGASTGLECTQIEVGDFRYVRARNRHPTNGSPSRIQRSSTCNPLERTDPAIELLEFACVASPIRKGEALLLAARPARYPS